MVSFQLNIGKKIYAMEGPTIPPVGARIRSHKHFSEDGSTYDLLEVISHDWELIEVGEDESFPELAVSVKTRIVG